MTYLHAHYWVALALALVVLAGVVFLLARVAVWWLHRPAAYPIQQFDNGWREGMPVQYPQERIDAWEDQRRHGIDPATGLPEWEDLDADEQADQLIAEWRDDGSGCPDDFPDGTCKHCGAAATEPHRADCAVYHPERKRAWNWQDDPDLIVWDAKQQADRCWQILYVEFPALRRELGIAA